jgi:hypothetical protein
VKYELRIEETPVTDDWAFKYNWRVLLGGRSIAGGSADTRWGCRRQARKMVRRWNRQRRRGLARTVEYFHDDEREGTQ